jgi:hypothetical protein
MFVGHYAVSFYIKSREPRIPLWVLCIAVQLVDVAWGILVWLGIEKLAMVPGITRASPLDLIYVPYTHSLLAVLGWALLAFWLWIRWGGKGIRRIGPAMLIVLAVLSHWGADFLVHRPDLPLYDNTAKVGLGLWNYPLVSFPLEVGLLGAAMYIWWRASAGQASSRNLVLLWVVMTAAQAYTNFGPLPTSPVHFVGLALGFYFVFALASLAVDASPLPDGRITA